MSSRVAIKDDPDERKDPMEVLTTIKFISNLGDKSSPAPRGRGHPIFLFS
jgi:hypothetical protein